MAIASIFPTIKPALSLDFANTKQLDPRITFSRATSGTYYDGKTFAKAEENLITQSESTSAVSGGTTINGNGTYTVASPTQWIYRTKITETPINTQFTVSVTLSGEGVVRLTGLNGGGGSIGSDVVVTLTATPTRYAWTGTNTATGVNTGVLVRGAADGSTATVRTEQWQMEFRGQATAYTPTTSQPITNYIPVLMTAPAGVARFDHNPVTGESLGLLIEESRANLLTYSEQVDNAAWAKSNATITANTIIAPDGNLTGDKIVEGAGSGDKNVQQNFSATAQTYTASAYAKAGGRSQVVFTFGTSGLWSGLNPAGRFDLSAKTFTIVNGSVTGTITDVGDGWYRCTMTATATASGTANIKFSLASADIVSYTGDGYSGIYIWGAQLEAGSFATSYIPTVASQVTRAAETASMTGTNFSSWYRQDEGTLYGETQLVGLASYTSFFFNITAANNTDYLSIGYGGAGSQPYFRSVVGNVDQALIQQGASISTTSNKFAGSYASNSFGFARGGSLGTSDTSGAVPVVSNLVFANRFGNDRPVSVCIKRLAYYPKRITDAQLQALTA